MCVTMTHPMVDNVDSMFRDPDSLVTLAITHSITESSVEGGTEGNSIKEVIN